MDFAERERERENFALIDRAVGESRRLCAESRALRERSRAGRIARLTSLGPPAPPQVPPPECPWLFVVEDDERESAATYCALMSRFGVVRVVTPVAILPMMLEWARGTTPD